MAKNDGQSDRAWALLLARSLLGLIFAMAGFWKVFTLGPLEHASGMFVEAYADTFLPTWSLWLTGTTIPAIELIAGVALLIGWRVRAAPRSPLQTSTCATLGFPHRCACPLHRLPGPSRWHYQR